MSLPHKYLLENSLGKTTTNLIALPVVVEFINPVDPLVEIGGGAGPRLVGGAPERGNC